ncbi:hypothetical protein SCUCBS95973_000911 [Sporothrix curviconia]|uniref:YTH domain-containing protein n=1 Tax=Sporothrix curviconia TaxID=1260050 RepID=A0ABP0AU66_9PEZI
MAVRLVSRLRKNSVEGAQGATAPTGPAALSQSPRSPHIDGKQQHVDGLGVNGDGTDAAAPVARDGMDKPRKPPVQTSVIVDGSDKSGTKGKSYEGGEWGSSSTPVSSGSDISAKSEKYFILKSLTLEDLELSVRTGLWATQSHNEKTLNEAYKSCDNVYLIFSANKSGEYFGYARMTSEINQDPAAAIEFAPTSQSFNDADLPKAIPTEATETTPRGRIIDDSARGTIFWEIQSDDAGEVDDKVMGDGIDNVDRVDGVDSPDGPDGVEGEDGIDSVDGVDGTGGSQTWGKPFKLEWLSTTRLPFYRTRGLRNPLNANREIKIARDGTDVDVAIGRKLVSLFRQEATSSPAAGSGSGSGSSRAGMPSSSSYSSLPGT